MAKISCLTFAAGAALAASVGFFAASPAGAASIYTVDLASLNGSGVTGVARLTLGDGTLRVRVRASNLQPGQIHPAHIHGRFNSHGNPRDSVLPTLADDRDGDGFIEVDEGAASYGPIILPLSSPPGGLSANFPVAAADGTVNFSETYDLGDRSIFAGNFDSNDLLPLGFREVVLHGDTVSSSAGAGTSGEVNGTGGYKPALPVAAGEIVFSRTDGNNDSGDNSTRSTSRTGTASSTVTSSRGTSKGTNSKVPEPATMATLAIGLGAMAFARLRRRGGDEG